MKIRKLEIQNYKIFDDVSFDFTDQEGKTLSTVVLAGMNGCGKTTVLELLEELFSKNLLRHDDESNIEIEIELTDEEKNGILEVNLIINGQEKQKKHLLEKVKSSETLQISGFQEMRIFASLIYYLPDFQKKYKYFPAKTDNSIANFKGEMKSNALKGFQDEILKNRDITPRVSIEKRISSITKSLSNLSLNTRLIDLESEELIFESANGQRIYFEQLSHGEQHLYFRAIYLSQLNLQNAVIMIDEPEAAFHPTWQQKIAELYSNVGKNNQVFLATHSPHVMASVPPESLFVLNVDETTKKITVINMDKAGKHSQGLEPNRILMEIMQVNSLRDYQTQMDINRLTALLTPEKFESKEAQNLIEKLSDQLGRQDPFIIRLEHQLLILNRKKQSLSPVA